MNGEYVYVIKVTDGKDWWIIPNSKGTKVYMTYEHAIAKAKRMIRAGVKWGVYVESYRMQLMESDEIKGDE